MKIENKKKILLGFDNIKLHKSVNNNINLKK